MQSLKHAAPACNASVPRYQPLHGDGTMNRGYTGHRVTNDRYDPKPYWEERLSRHSGLRGVGHISFGERYNQWLYRAKDRALSRALDESSIAGLDVLDVGCGTGYFVDWYAARGARVSGLDLTEASVARLRLRHSGDFRVLDIGAPDAAPSDRYDVVNVWDVMYHIVDEAAFLRGLRFIAGSVRQGGLLLISDRLAAPGDLQVAEHVRMRCLESYRARLEDLGLEFVGLTFLYKWLNRYVSLPIVDSMFGRFYFWLDGRRSSPAADNISLGLWRRRTSS